MTLLFISAIIRLMKEGQPKDPIDKDKNSNKDRIRHIRNTIAAAGVGGILFGGITYAVSNLFTGSDNAERLGTVVTGSSASAMAGIGLSNISLGRAEDHLEQGKKDKAKLKVIRASLESAAGFGTAGAFVGFNTGSLTNTLIGTGLGVAFGGYGVIWEYERRTRPFPNFIIPSGNSMERDITFPDREGGVKFPPVFRTLSLRDLKEFRKVNKEKIIKWAGGIAHVPEKSSNPNSPGADRLVTSVIIIPNLQHYPAFDPEGTPCMKLVDVKNNEEIVVYPNKESHSFWPYQTCFEARFGESRYFLEEEWNAWKDQSWNHNVTLLVQYQKNYSAFSKSFLKKAFSSSYPGFDEISDNYWLLDISSSGGIQRRKVDKKVPQGVLSKVGVTPK